MSELIHFIYFGAAIGFFALPFKQSRFRASWARLMFFIISALFIILGAGGVALDFQFLKLSHPGLLNLEHFLQAIRGFILGCVFVLLISGQLMGKKIQKGQPAA